MTPNQFRTITTQMQPYLTPEITLGSVSDETEFHTIWAQNQNSIGAVSPYWMVPWPGGQGLARFILDRPQIVADRDVIDLGCGNGLVAIAASMAGARSVIAVDLDPNALIAAEENAASNNVRIQTKLADIRNFTIHPTALTCAADLWYEQVAGRHATNHLTQLSRIGADVLFCHGGRSFRPRLHVVPLATYNLPVSEGFECSPELLLQISTFDFSDIPATHTPHVL